MKALLVILIMFGCLFGPMVIFSWVGHAALRDLGKRPSNAGKAMTFLITKLVVTTIGVCCLLILALRIFGQQGIDY